MSAHTQHDVHEEAADEDSVRSEDEEGRSRASVCPHCGASREGPYCHACGQRYLGERMTLGELWQIFHGRFLQVEKGLWPTARDLLVRPGVLIRRFVQGDRRHYLNPMSALVLCVTLYAPLSNALKRWLAPEAGAAATQAGGDSVSVLALTGAVDAEQGFLTYATLLGVLIVGPFLQVFFSNQDLNLTESLVLVLYACAAVFLWGVPLTLGYTGVTGAPPDDVLRGYLAFLLFLVVMVQAAYGYFGDRGMAGYAGVAAFLSIFCSVVGGAFLMGLLVGIYNLVVGASAV